MTAWKQMGKVSPSAVKEARLEAHHAVQWLARMARAFCTPEADDSHTSLTWNTEKEVLFARPLAKDLTAGLRVRDLSLVMQSGEDQQRFQLMWHSEQEVGAWIAKRLSSRERDASKLQNPQPYALPPHPLDEGGLYGQTNPTAYEELGTYYSNASHLFEYVRASQQGAVACPLLATPFRYCDLDCAGSIWRGGG